MADLLTKAVMKNISNKALNKKTCKKEENKKIENINCKEVEILKSILYKNSKKNNLNNLNNEKHINKEMKFKSLKDLNHNIVVDKNINTNNKCKNMISLKDLAK
ncbi:hypothetical protein C672_2166 [[Clostridium] bifermentans ATCC 638]|uniref:Uncharacterized protein n=1 Tax=Paraclostridium bifermentans ATCC 638 = DSM 14991 TaxID=1233171 RepID=T4VRB3_PARBF|nr:hypothetical protein [Paraclostridium bifermentans]EQK43222.1 hypothetical protein C672_2166 [[Clostridium] bifermentans ATCC 638] [Paraclostridium bifermentans ATCC 638 = DSM 14991]RIZ60445.1 hypothetical protein CHH45_01360 [Paraclostridium bifermentans]UAG17087.1 hypothetical protein KXZ80_09855 [Paraclostridium bifermentans]